MQAEQQAQTERRNALAADLSVLTDNILQGSSPAAIARKGVAQQASALAVLHQVSTIALNHCLQVVLYWPIYVMPHLARP